MSKKSLETEIDSFLDDWNMAAMVDFMRDILPLVELYDVDENDDWVERKVGKDETKNIRLIKTVELVSRIADMHAGKLCRMSCSYPSLWRRMRTAAQDQIDNLETLDRLKKLEERCYHG